MILLWLATGFIPPTVLGWALLKILEGRTAILYPLERWLCGFALGSTVAMLAIFVLHIWTELPLTWWSFLVVEVALALVAVAIARTFAHHHPHPLPESEQSPRPVKIVVSLLVAWAVVKILAGTYLIMTTPTFFDDALDNWNYRAKVFADHGAIMLALPPDTTPSPVSSYPPTVSLIKANLVLLYGSWSEAMANLPHVLWLIACGGILWYMIRRRVTNPSYAWLGVAVYWSMPLGLIHGTNPYSDVFLSLHYLCLVHFAILALMERTPERVMACVRLLALPLALLPFTKNEGLALYLPSGLLLTALAGFLIVRRKIFSKKKLLRAILWIALPLALVLAAWVGFKVMHGLTFGNAKGLTGIFAGWQENVLLSIAINTFLEGNWLLLFPFLILLLLRHWRAVPRHPVLLMLTVAAAIPYLAQVLLFLFTSLSVEALMQTGYARGIIHILPILTVLFVLLIERTLSRR